LGFAYEFAWIGDMPIDQNRGPLAGHVAGSYNNANLSVVAANLTWTY